MESQLIKFESDMNLKGKINELNESLIQKIFQQVETISGSQPDGTEQEDLSPVLDPPKLTAHS